jgi:hypothetical protein
MRSLWPRWTANVTKAYRALTVARDEQRMALAFKVFPQRFHVDVVHFAVRERRSRRL